MSPRRESRQEHWDTYWEAAPVEEVYESVGDLVDELSRWKSLEGARVLEVGAGSGRDSLLLAERGARVTVLDYSPAALDVVAGQTQGRGVGILRGDALALPFAEGSFDIVFHQGLLEHFRDPMPLLRENARVLAPGGIVLVDVPQRWHYYTLIKRLLIALDRWFAGWECSFSARELEARLGEAGLSPLGSYADWPEPGLLYRIFRKLTGKLGLRLPQHPRPLPLLDPAGRRLRRALRYRRLGQYTAMVIGTVAEKPGGPRD